MLMMFCITLLRSLLLRKQIYSLVIQQNNTVLKASLLTYEQRLNGASLIKNSLYFAEMNVVNSNVIRIHCEPKYNLFTKKIFFI